MSAGAGAARTAAAAAAGMMMSLSQEDSGLSQDSVMTVMDENASETLYFAYGSNLSTAQMRQRCPHSTPIGLGYLEGWRWIINERGYANVVPTTTTTAARAAEQTEDNNSSTSLSSRADTPVGSSGPYADGVFGMLYLLPLQDEERLDRYEGVPWAYQKIKCKIRWESSERGGAPPGELMDVTAWVYVDVERTTGGHAALDEYVGRMETGLHDAVEKWGLGKAYASEIRRWIREGREKG